MRLIRPYIHAVAIATTLSVTALSAGCSKAPVSGVFVDKTSPTEVDMVRVVESPPGHLAGSMVVTAINQDGSEKTANFSVTGSINGSNVSLQVGGGMVGLAKLFGANTILVGALRGQTLALSIDNSTFEFHRVSDQQYQEDLASLNTAGKHMALVQQATKAMREVISYDRDVDSSLQQYVTWSQARINHVSDVRDWYANRINGYTVCLDHVKPMAAAHVPVWQWQECVLTIENDKYYRVLEVADLRNLQEQNQQAVERLSGKLALAQARFANAVQMLRSSCPYKPNANECATEVGKLQAMGRDGFINKDILSSFELIVPKVKAAIGKDTATVSAGEARLSSIAQQVSSIYRSASTQ